jgi:LuxR family transcriptional regulator, maltose regulon positive regulatory protein
MTQKAGTPHGAPPPPLPPEVHAHKFFAPPMPGRSVRRKALFERLAARPEVRVVVLQGPAGHGKSTSLQQIKTACEAEGKVTAWLSFDDADNDPRRFFPHMQALVTQLHPLGEASLPESRGRRRSDWIIERLHALKRPTALFLDEFQALTAPALLQFFREFLEHVPGNVTVYIGSRAVPDIGVARGVVEGRVLVMNAEALRFSLPEVQQFFAEANDLAMAPAEVEAIYRRTEGWPAALQLFRLSLARRNVRDALGEAAAHRPRELADYLTDNVLALQEPEMQEFLLCTALLARLSAPLCEAVTGLGPAQPRLEALERSGLFLRALDADLRWFKYHGLFATCLGDLLSARNPARALEVHRRAAQWFAEAGLPAETLHHALACEDLALAGDTLESWAPLLVANGQLITLSRWAEQLPFEIIRSRPELLVCVAWAYVFLHRRAPLKPLLAELEALEQQGLINPDIVLSMAAISVDDLAEAFRRVERVDLYQVDVDGFTAFELSAAGNLAGYREMAIGDFEAARQKLSLARLHGERGLAPFSGGYNGAVSSMLRLVQGDLQGALDRLRGGAAEQRHNLDRSLSAAALMACYIFALYEADELDMAERLFDEYHDIIVESTLPDFAVVALIVMSRIDAARGRGLDAASRLDEIEDISQAYGWGRMRRLLAWERVRCALAAGQLAHARACAAAAPPPPPDLPEGIPFSDDLVDAAFGRIRLLIHGGEFVEARRLLDLEAERQPTRAYRHLRRQLLEMLWQLRQGHERPALRALIEALRLATPGGFVRCLLEEGPALGPLLQKLRENPPIDIPGVAAHLDRLLAAAGLSDGRVRDDRLPLEDLTERERSILELLAQGVSNKELARRMSVSENTVKFHLKNIYSKLAVDNRLRAITAARECGLIH